MSEASAHIDGFARERLPPREQWPVFDLDLPLFSIELQSMAERLLQPLRFFAGRLTIFELKFHRAGQRELK